MRMIYSAYTHVFIILLYMYLSWKNVYNGFYSVDDEIFVVYCCSFRKFFSSRIHFSIHVKHWHTSSAILTWNAQNNVILVEFSNWLFLHAPEIQRTRIRNSFRFDFFNLFFLVMCYCIEFLWMRIVFLKMTLFRTIESPFHATKRYNLDAVFVHHSLHFSRRFFFSFSFLHLHSAILH